MPTETQHIVIAGATGEIGRQLVRQASARAGVAVYALTRRAGACSGNPAVQEVVFNFEDPREYDSLFQRIPCDVLFLALGSTRKKAGVSGLVRVERDYPIALIDALSRHRPGARIGYVSSVGADSPSGAYLKAKADVEERLRNCNLPCVIARPSLLLSRRAEFRLGEVIARKALAPPWLWAIRKFAPGSQRLWKWAPVPVGTVAASLLNMALNLSGTECRILEGLDLREL
ncbi:MAG: hypothetical protein CXZ00_00900 [Acidobacteria bacterium]|nr:MAG: hypothetical protein CXZ00_00900 [Acidobacteriota bacterium]